MYCVLHFLLAFVLVSELDVNYSLEAFGLP